LDSDVIKIKRPGFTVYVDSDASLPPPLFALCVASVYLFSLLSLFCSGGLIVCCFLSEITTGLPDEPPGNGGLFLMNTY
jgi:hypothetical protein